MDHFCDVMVNAGGFPELLFFFSLCLFPAPVHKDRPWYLVFFSATPREVPSS